MLSRSTSSLSTVFHNIARYASSTTSVCRFGLALDADGVITRGRELLPGSREGLQMLVDVDGKFKIPTVFVTNASNTMRATKAARLTELTGVHVHPSQVIMAHSPLRLFSDLQDKALLVCGQGPVRDIAFALGFRDVTTTKDLRTFMPQLDVVDSRRRNVEPFKLLDHGFKPIEAVLLLGEPINWESALQLVIDVLLTNGLKEMKDPHPPYPHLPVYACNLDLFWMGEKDLPMPRLGHGMFFECLDRIYNRITGNNIRCKAIIGKPSEATYMHAAHCLEEQAAEFGFPPLRHIYAVGDNPDSDILGANLFEQHLQTGENGRFDNVNLASLNKKYYEKKRKPCELKHCFSTLIETGVKAEAGEKKRNIEQSVSTMHKKLTHREVEELKMPALIDKDLRMAIQTICEREKFSINA